MKAELFENTFQLLLFLQLFGQYFKITHRDIKEKFTK